MSQWPWLSAFLLQPPTHIAAAGHPNAAVLLPLVELDGKWHFLMTRRALHLRHHPGQVSFPGGRIDPGETPQEAALRELTEETGITREFVTLLGQLPAINTSTGFIVQPYLAALRSGFRLQLSADEVDSLVYLPCALALEDHAWVSETWPLRKRLQQLHFLAVDERLVWGASAQILRQLSQQLGINMSTPK